MTLGKLVGAITRPDHYRSAGVSFKDLLQMPVVFDTRDRGNLQLISVYYHNGKIHIDIGDENDS